jgi:NADP-dependent 3-hydroxy acid dehydrogenase YdfG
MTNPEIRQQIRTTRDQTAISPDAIARAIAFVIEEPSDVDVNEIVVRPTAQA